MDAANTLNKDIVGLIMRLDRDGRQNLARYAEFLYGEQAKDAPIKQAEKEEALRNLSRHRGILGDENPGEVLAEAMRDKYGHDFRECHERAV